MFTICAPISAKSVAQNSLTEVHNYSDV